METAEYQPTKLERRIGAYLDRIDYLEDELKQARQERQEAQDRLEEFLGLVVAVDDEKDTEAPEIDHVKILVEAGYIVMLPDDKTFMSRRGRSLLVENDELREKLRSSERENAILSGMGGDDGC